MALKNWLMKHPYLRPMADFHLQVSEAARNALRKYAGIPDWHEYTNDYKRGIPVLHSSCCPINYTDVESMLASLLEKLTAMPFEGKLRTESLQLYSELHDNPELLRHAVERMLGNVDSTLSHPGLFRHIGWTAMAQYLSPMVTEFENWRDEEAWLQPYCPICGSGPSMSQLVGTDPGRRRLLVCGCCEARWRFRRIGCPFCDNANNHKLSVLAIEGEKQLRIDYCGSCGGYLKTYDGEGDEPAMLADWTSTHLDVLAIDRGFKRLANSLYDL
jgi:FdhE protein